jgi:hypothetical protein
MIKKLTLNKIRYFNSSGLGNPTLSSRRSVTSAGPSSSRKMEASIFCCSRSHRVSAEIMTGYGELTNAYFLIALHIDLTETERVNVTRWYATGSTSPSCTSTKASAPSRANVKVLTFNATAICEQDADVSLNGAFPPPLLADEIRIMGARDIVFGQRTSHVRRYSIGVVGRREECS